MNCMLRHIPLLASPQGGVAARSNKKSRSYLVPRRRGGFPFRPQSENHPGLAISGGFAKSFDRSATPPCGDARRGMTLASTFVHKLADLSQIDVSRYGGPSRRGR